MEDFSKYQTIPTGPKRHYKSVLEELVMTHGGQRAKDEYKKLVEDKQELIEALINITTKSNYKNWKHAHELAKEMEGKG